MSLAFGSVRRREKDPVGVDPGLQHRLFVMDLRQKLADAEDMVETEIEAARVRFLCFIFGGWLYLSLCCVGSDLLIVWSVV